MFARAVNENSDIKSALNDVILFSVDCEKGEGIEIAKTYNVSGYPTFIAMNSEGKVTDRWIGYDGPEAWATVAKAAAADSRTIVEKKKAFEADPTAGLAICLANDASTGYEFRTAAEYFGKARELDPANADEYTKNILESMYYGSRGGVFTFDEVEAEAKPAMASANATLEDKVSLASMLRNVAQKMEMPERAVPYIETALEISKGTTDEDVLAIRVNLEIDYALMVEKDGDKAVKLYRTTLGEGWMENANRLNNFAWWCFENDVNLDEALEMALKGVEIAESDASQANILDTAAEICNKLGNCEQAVEHIQRAIELDPDKQYFKDQLANFQKVLEEKQNG